MAQKDTDKTTPKANNSREDRLKAALKANMARRKAQVRARSGETGAAAEADKDKG